jgi:tetratricopeptide (TPR) repeat protein
MRFQIILLCIGLAIANPSIAQRKKKNNDKAPVPAPVVNNPEFDSFFYKALKEKTKDNHSEAIALFEKCYSLNPQNDAVNYELSILYASTGASKKALDYAKRATEINPENVWYQANLAKIYEDLGDFGSSAKVYEILNAKYPDQISYFFLLANAYIFSNQFGKAIDTYSVLESKIGVNQDIAIQKIKLYINQKKNDRADVEAEKLLKVDEDTENYVKIGELFMSAEAFDYGFKYFKRGLEKDSLNGFLQLAVSDYYRYKGNNKEALNYLGKAIVNREIDVDTKIKILLPFIQFAADTAIFTPLLKVVQGITIAHPNESRAFALYGDFLSQVDKQYPTAIEQYKKAIQLDSSKYALFDQIIRLQFSQNQYKASIPYIESAIERFPNQAILYLFAGIAYAQEKDYAQAKQHLETGLNYAGSNKDLKAELYSSLGDVLNELKEFESSYQAYDSSLAINPNQAFVLNNYSYYLSLQSNSLEKARKMSAKSLEIDPNNSSFLDTYAWILFKLKDYQGAKEFIEKAIKQQEPSAVVLEHYGDILFKLGEKDKALSNWTRALEMDKNNAVLKRKVNDKAYYE